LQIEFAGQVGTFIHRDKERATVKYHTVQPKQYVGKQENTQVWTKRQRHMYTQILAKKQTTSEVSSFINIIH